MNDMLRTFQRYSNIVKAYGTRIKTRSNLERLNCDKFSLLIPLSPKAMQLITGPEQAA